MKKSHFSRQGHPENVSPFFPKDVHLENEPHMFLLPSKQEVLRLERKSVIMYLQGVIDSGHNDTVCVWGFWYAEKDVKSLLLLAE